MSRNGYARLFCSAAAITMISAGAAWADDAKFNIQPQSLNTALNAFSEQSAHPVLFKSEMASEKLSPGISGAADPEAALSRLLAGTGLSWRRAGDTFVIVQAGEGGAGPQGAGAGGNAVQALIVTAQKKEENIQDVPIAISAFSAKQLEAQKIEGGFDLLKAIPNVTFSKSNFSSYNFSIRGVGTKAISATTDPGVSVAFNSTGLIQNRLFEQEYFDIERVEVLRGPQGTLYGRNATSGVINVISAKPDLSNFEAAAKGEVGNYSAQRVSAMLNIPIVNDVLGVRLAGAWTKREGYDYNSVTEHAVNGRDLWSSRLTIGFEPNDRLRADLIWEHFEEDDDRSRTGKQLCHRDPGPSMIGGRSPSPRDTTYDNLLGPALFAQGCLPGNLYDDAAFGTPNGLSLSFIFGHLLLTSQPFGSPVSFLGFDPDGNRVGLIKLQDPYDNMMQSRDLRTIASFRDPRYRAKADVVELNFDFDITDSLTLTSQTAYNKDQVYSFQDYNRFNTVPIFTDTSTLILNNGNPSRYRPIAPGGVFCDPQLGCSDTIAGFDISQADGKQFSQEFRVQSSFDGPVNFSLGANYTEFKTLIDYYVMYNIITAMALAHPFNAPFNNEIDFSTCALGGFVGLSPGNTPIPIDDPGAYCPYIDPNPVESINGEGHNYFRSKNPYKLKSWAGFGELYWNITDTVKLTAGLRYTKDKKAFTPVPSQVLLSPGIVGGGVVNRGYPEKEPIVQKWGEWTGRLGLDWKPDLGFTDETLLYVFYSHGYKGGGANPPTPGFATLDDFIEGATAAGVNPNTINFYVNGGFAPVLKLTAQEYGPTFEPEFVDAYEIGAKNTLLDGAMTLNLTAFYYDYKDYQVSQIRDRTAVNENFDAKIWGLELEGTFSPTRDLQIIGNLGYLDTEISDGETSIDIMNRTQGNPDYIIAKPWPQLPSNCVVPVAVAAEYIRKTEENGTSLSASAFKLCGGVGGIISASPTPIDPATGLRYDPAYYDGTNGTVDLHGGAGIFADLGGNELPNAPHWTTNIGVQYGFDIPYGWRMTVRGDAYWQSQSWHRVYNSDPYDKLHGWYNANLSVWFEQPDNGWKVELYAKNILDDTPITDAFLNSDDTGLTTNVFVLDPRLIGLSVRKEF